MTGDAGPQIDALRRARRFEREMLGRRSARVRVRAPAHGTPEEESFACAWVCTGCGLMRDAPTSPADIDAACGYCKARAWIDLRSTRNAQLLREQEARMRQEAPDWVQRRVRATAGVTAVAVGGVAALAASALLPLLAPVAVIAAAAGGAGALAVDTVLGKPLSRWLLARADVGPARWRCALPKPDLGSPIVARHEGEATSRQPPLAAPISGRECLAYEVGVVFDAEGDAYPPVWAIREDRNVALQVDGVAIARDALTTELTLHAIPEGGTRPDDELRKFLRQRGLFAADGTYAFFESIVAVGARMVLHRHASPPSAGWVAVDPTAA